MLFCPNFNKNLISLITVASLPMFIISSHLSRLYQRCLLLTTKRCVIITSSVGSYRSQYITISSSFTDAFLPSSPHSTITHLALRRPCCRRCQIAETSRAAGVTASSLLSKKSQTLSSHFATVSSSSRFQSSLQTSTSLPN